MTHPETGIPRDHRYVILTQGATHPTPAKTAAGMLRYRREAVVALLDSEQAGRDAGELMGAGAGVPIIATLQEAVHLGANALLIGVAPAGGELPLAWRAILVEAIRGGLDIVSGLHLFLSEDAEFRRLAAAHRVRLIDLRRPPQELGVNCCRAAQQPNLRIHTVGSDCNCGKKIAALEIDAALRRRGLKSTFIATGQTGILISGRGIAMDRVISDFVAGAAERLVLEAAGCDYLVIEGQGALTHPLYGGVTLSMLYGFAPQLLVLCHPAERKILRGTPDTPIPSLPELIALYEAVTRPVFPAKVIGVALNLMAFAEEKARAEVERVEKELKLPVTDVIRFGAEKLVEAILARQAANPE